MCSCIFFTYAIIVSCFNNDAKQIFSFYDYCHSEDGPLKIEKGKEYDDDDDNDDDEEEAKEEEDDDDQ